MLSINEVKEIGETIGINWDEVDFDFDQLHKGILIEFEHGLHDPETDVIGNNPELAAKIAWAHLKEFPDYYDRLEKEDPEVVLYPTEIINYQTVILYVHNTSKNNSFTEVDIQVSANNVHWSSLPFTMCDKVLPNEGCNYRILWKRKKLLLAEN
jgi:hypothetical protein